MLELFQKRFLVYPNSHGAYLVSELGQGVANYDVTIEMPIVVSRRPYLLGGRTIRHWPTHSNDENRTEGIYGSSFSFIYIQFRI